MMGSMERNVGGRIIYQQSDRHYALDCRTCPYAEWGALPLGLNIWQNIGQLKIWFLAVEYAGLMTVEYVKK